MYYLLQTGDVNSELNESYIESMHCKKETQNQVRIKVSSPAFHSVFFPFAPQDILSTDSYISQTILGFFTLDPAARIHPHPNFCLPALMSAQGE